MTKLTAERLDEIANIKITEFSDGTDTANGAYQSVGSSEIVLMARQLLAYEQAAKTATAITTDEEMLHVTHGSNGQIFAECRSDDFERKGLQVIKLYAAPVLPKQPDVTLTNEGETYKIIKAAEKFVRCKGRYHSEQNYSALAALFGVTVPDLPPLSSDEAPAQPVIPEVLLQAINRLLDNDGSRGCFDALEQHRAKTELERLLAAVQQNEPQNIPENIPAQPISELRARAIALYKPPFKFDFGYIWDAGGQMAADQNLNEDGQILRVRGWGRISYLENAEALQDEVGEVIAIALSDYWNRNIDAAPAQESE